MTIGAPGTGVLSQGLSGLSICEPLQAMPWSGFWRLGLLHTWLFNSKFPPAYYNQYLFSVNSWLGHRSPFQMKIPTPLTSTLCDRLLHVLSYFSLSVQTGLWLLREGREEVSLIKLPLKQAYATPRPSILSAW